METKTINVFLASSLDELRSDRESFGNFVRRLDKIYLKRNVHVNLDECEELDASYNGVPKQDEYDDIIRKSDMFLALFHQEAGKHTIHEFDVAREHSVSNSLPKVYVYLKNLQQGEKESVELTEFKRYLKDELQYYWIKCANQDAMQLHFIMQLQLLESNRIEALMLEEDGQLTFDGFRIAHMKNLPFAADNDAYKNMSAELNALPDQIEELRKELEKTPDNEFLHKELQKKLNRKNELKEDLAKLQQNLFATAKTIADLQQQRINARLQRAIDTFDTGDLKGANAILREIAIDADCEHHLDNYNQQKSLAEKSQYIVHQDIDAFRLQAKTVIADVSIPISGRIGEVARIYAKADDWAKHSDYDKVKYAKLLFDYAHFCYEYGPCEKAKQIYLGQIEMCEKLFGKEHIYTATAYNNIGVIYRALGEYDKSLEFLFKALKVRHRVIGFNHNDTAGSYINIGGVYKALGKYSKALEYYFKGLNICKNVLGMNHSDTATAYNNIGNVYQKLGDKAKALKFHFKALKIREKVLGPNHPDTAGSYNNIGGVYQSQGDSHKALSFFLKALAIQEKMLGQHHLSTATSYNNIGGVLYTQGDYQNALKYYLKDLAICEKQLGLEHPDTATSYDNIGWVYCVQKDYLRALMYFQKANEIRIKKLGEKHPDTQDVKKSIELVRCKMYGGE